MSIWKSDINPATKTQEIFIENGDTLPARFNVDFRDIKEGAKIGQGNWTVHKAQWLGREVAVKKFNCDNTFHNVSLTSKEVNRMLSLRHPNILKLLGFYVLAQEDLVLQCSMIMELMDCDLDGYIEKRSGIENEGPGGFLLSDDQLLYIMAEIARGMKHIHERGCFHRDLKPKNVLMRESDVTGFNVDVKVADFGSSELMRDGHSDRTAGTLLYKAPEQFNKVGKLFPDMVDVFSFGALCSKILTGKEPYEDHPNVIELIRNGGKPTIPNRNLPEDVLGVIRECLNTKPEARPDFQKISGILDGALEEVRKKMPRPLTTLTRISSHSRKPLSNGRLGDDHLVSIVEKFGLPKWYIKYFIPSEEIFVIGQLGRGSFGSVYKVEWKGTLYAQKIFDDYVSNDLINFPRLVHKNIVTFMGYSVTSDNRISIIMELLSMDLNEFLYHDKFEGRELALDEHKRWTILKEIAEGMQYLHGQGVGHGDLKPYNVVVSAVNTDEMVVKLIDFGLDPKWCSTRYAAPEILIGRMRGHELEVMAEVDFKQSDVYSFGMVCHEILGGASLDEYIPVEFKHAIVRGERPKLPMGTSQRMKDLFEKCWDEDPLKRPTFSEVCEFISRTMEERGFAQTGSPPKSFAQTCKLL